MKMDCNPIFSCSSRVSSRKIAVKHIVVCSFSVAEKSLDINFHLGLPRAVSCISRGSKLIFSAVFTKTQQNSLWYCPFLIITEKQGK